MITTARARALGLLAVVCALGATACHGKGSETPERPCRADVGDDLETAGRTGVEGVKTGATTAVEGVKTFGSATAGMVEGGTSGAKEKWNQGAEKTSETADQGAAKTKSQALPRCKH